MPKPPSLADHPPFVRMTALHIAKRIIGFDVRRNGWSPKEITKAQFNAEAEKLLESSKLIAEAKRRIKFEETF